jgi:hypothetical protein
MWNPEVQTLGDKPDRTKYVWSKERNPNGLAILGLDGPTYSIERGLLIMTTIYGEREVTRASDDIDFIRDLNKLFSNTPYITMEEIHSITYIRKFIASIYSSTWLVGDDLLQ